MQYLDFELEIGAGTGRDYPVAVLNSPAGEAHETMRFPFDALALENRLQALQIALLRSGGERRRVLSPEEQTVQDFGGELFNALLSGEIRSRYDLSREKAHQQHKGLRLKLRLQSPQLAALPWEFLYDKRGDGYLSLSRKTPIIRYLELPKPIPVLQVEPPLQILAMLVSPADLPPLNVAREKERIERATQGLQNKGALKLTWWPGQTWQDLQSVMRVGPWHVFHFVGHGGYDPNLDEGLIALADDQNRQHLITATDLATLLTDHTHLRLVFLNTCEGAKGSERDIFSSTAAILVRRGLPALLAMQYEITDAAAIEFSRLFYETLAEGWPLDMAVAEARKAVTLAINNTLEWGTPVLYMRSPDGVLFEISKTMPPPQPARLFVETIPSNATVRILNPVVEFSQGLELQPGRYYLEVSAEGYETQKEWLQLEPGWVTPFVIKLQQLEIPHIVKVVHRKEIFRPQELISWSLWVLLISVSWFAVWIIKEKVIVPYDKDGGRGAAQMLGIIWGLSIGLSQWLVLRRQKLPVIPWLLAIAWVFATVVGITVNCVYDVAWDNSPIQRWALWGAILGTFQLCVFYLVIEIEISRAAWWLLISALAAALGSLWYGPSPLWPFTNFLVGTVYGAVTGLGLLWLFKPRQ